MQLFESSIFFFSGRSSPRKLQHYLDIPQNDSIKRPFFNASRSRQLIIFDNFFHVNASRSQIRSPVGTAEELFATLKTLRNRTAGRRTQDGRMTKKCRARMCTSGLVRHFSSICRPECVFQPSCCVRSLFLLRDITLLRVGSILTRKISRLSNFCLLSA